VVEILSRYALPKGGARVTMYLYDAGGSCGGDV